MTHCDKRDPEHPESHFAIGVSILLLALAVFGWGLHSKLSLYHVRARATAKTPVAKLLSERERPIEIAAAQYDAPQPTLQQAVLAAAIFVAPRPSHSRRTAIETHSPRRHPVPLERYSLRRPPPSLSI